MSLACSRFARRTPRLTSSRARELAGTQTRTVSAERTSVTALYSLPSCCGLGSLYLTIRCNASSGNGDLSRGTWIIWRPAAHSSPETRAHPGGGSLSAPTQSPKSQVSRVVRMRQVRTRPSPSPVSPGSLKGGRCASRRVHPRRNSQTTDPVPSSRACGACQGRDQRPKCRLAPRGCRTNCWNSGLSSRTRL